jgi:large repetitive protein
MSRSAFHRVACACVLSLLLGARTGAADGNVAVRIEDGDLLVRGDGGSNRISVAPGSTVGREPADLLFVVGADGTTVNGEAFVVVQQVDGGFSIEMGGGDDRIDLEDLSGRSAPSFLDVATGAGSDLIGLWDVNVAGDLVVRTGPGDDAVVGDGITFDRHLRIDLGAGNDRLVSSLLRGNASRGRSAIDTGEGDDVVELDTPTFTGPVAVSTGPGDDTLFFFGRFDGAASFDAGAGDDSLVLHGTVLAGPTRIVAGNGNDAVALIESTLTGVTVLRGGAGEDALEISASRFGEPPLVSGFETAP